MSNYEAWLETLTESQRSKVAFTVQRANEAAQIADANEDPAKCDELWHKYHYWLSAVAINLMATVGVLDALWTPTSDLTAE